MVDLVLDRIRKLADNCTGLQGFMVTVIGWFHYQVILVLLSTEHVAMACFLSEIYEIPLQWHSWLKDNYSIVQPQTVSPF